MSLSELVQSLLNTDDKVILFASVELLQDFDYQDITSHMKRLKVKTVKVNKTKKWYLKGIKVLQNAK